MKGMMGPKLAKTSTSKNMGSLAGTSVKGKSGNIHETKLPKGGCPSNYKKASRGMYR